jgi:hypothetical protein
VNERADGAFPMQSPRAIRGVRDIGINNEQVKVWLFGHRKVPSFNP